MCVYFMTKKCPTCNKPFPFWRTPTSLNQALWGGWTCEHCGSETDRKEKLIKSKKQCEEELFNEEYIKEKARLKARKDYKKNEKL